MPLYINKISRHEGARTFRGGFTSLEKAQGNMIESGAVRGIVLDVLEPTRSSIKIRGNGTKLFDRNKVFEMFAQDVHMYARTNILLI